MKNLETSTLQNTSPKPLSASLKKASAKVRVVDHGMSTSKILNAVLDRFKLQFSPDSQARVLDIGSGQGTLGALIRDYAPNTELRCADYTAELMRLKDVKVDLVDLNREKLPYSENTFDFVACVEVLEHLENFRFAVRESFRALKPGGTAVFTTPNVLNIKSRIRYALVGFASAFTPLKTGRADQFSLNGHITPISFYFLAHAMSEAGYQNIQLEVDKFQRSSFLPVVFFYPLIKFFSLIPTIHEKRKGRLVQSNLAFYKNINSIKMLTSRTIIVSGVKA